VSRIGRNRRRALAAGIAVIGVLVAASAAFASTTIHGQLSLSDTPLSYINAVGAGPSSCTKGSPFGYSGGLNYSDWYLFKNTTSKTQCVDVRVTPAAYCTRIGSWAEWEPYFISLGESGSNAPVLQHYSFNVAAGAKFNVVVEGAVTYPECTYALTVQIGRLGPAVYTASVGSPFIPQRP